MPIEIKELIIKATIADEDRGSSDGRRNGGFTSVSNTDSIEKWQIIEECVNQVLTILEQNKDR
ncbi:MAG: DUF5908 family protein [Thermodesulfobacteriota bacterium]|nr:DUF5908 family protein [Thermodesulfobacteriota bacterium]